jgi:hypothetical protein
MLVASFHWLVLSSGCWNLGGLTQSEKQTVWKGQGATGTSLGRQSACLQCDASVTLVGLHSAICFFRGILFSHIRPGVVSTDNTNLTSVVWVADLPISSNGC